MVNTEKYQEVPRDTSTLPTKSPQCAGPATTVTTGVLRFCLYHLERVGREIPATQYIDGTYMCQNCFDGKPILGMESAGDPEPPEYERDHRANHHKRGRSVKPRELSHPNPYREIIVDLFADEQRATTRISLKGRTPASITKNIHAAAKSEGVSVSVRTMVGYMDVRKLSKLPLRRLVENSLKEGYWMPYRLDEHEDPHQIQKWAHTYAHRAGGMVATTFRDGAVWVQGRAA